MSITVPIGEPVALVNVTSGRVLGRGTKPAPYIVTSPPGMPAPGRIRSMRGMPFVSKFNSRISLRNRCSARLQAGMVPSAAMPP